MADNIKTNTADSQCNNEDRPATSSQITIGIPRSTLICIDGSIGSGKSQAINEIVRLGGDRYRCHPEPVNEWVSFGGVNWLKECYTQNKRQATYSRAFCNLQNVILGSMIRRQQHIEQLIKEEKDLPLETRPIHVMERSHRSCSVFISVNQDFLDPLDKVACEAITNSTVETCRQTIGPTIYLVAEPEVLQQRVCNRNRPGEETLSLGYLKRINDAYIALADSDVNSVLLNTDNLSSREVAMKILDYVVLNDNNLKKNIP